MLEFLPSVEGSVTGIDLGNVMTKLFAQSESMDEAMLQIPEKFRDEALRAFVQNPDYQISRRPFADTIEFIARQPAGTNRDAALMFNAGLWAREDPLAAGAWVGQLEPGGLRNNAVMNVASTWATIYFDAASQWALGLEDPKERSYALGRTIESGALSSPEQVVALASSIVDPGMRSYALSSGLVAIARRDPERAVELLEGADLSDATHQEVDRVAAEATALLDLLDE